MIRMFFVRKKLITPAAGVLFAMLCIQRLEIG